uniref:AraC family transcriptional regulator n=1 Tax=Heterorhabditis bacteriophora TaxID=37862 RepID=A0A1I7WF07_HETBA
MRLEVIHDEPQLRLINADVLLGLFSNTHYIAKSIGFRSDDFDGQMSLQQKSGNCY